MYDKSKTGGCLKMKSTIKVSCSFLNAWMEQRIIEALLARPMRNSSIGCDEKNFSSYEEYTSVPLGSLV